MKSSLQMDLLGRIHKFAKETHCISDVKTCNDQVDRFPRKLAIGVDICK